MHAHVSGCLILGFPIAGFPIVVNFTTCMVHVKECEDHRSSQTEIIPNISMISSCTKAYKLQKFHKIHNNGVILLTNRGKNMTSSTEQNCLKRDTNHTFSSPVLAA